MWSDILFLRETSRNQKMLAPAVLQQKESVESSVIFFSDMMATEEWKREVTKHENIIKELEKKYEKKCKTLKVQMGLCFDHCKANTVVTVVQRTHDMKCRKNHIHFSLLPKSRQTIILFQT